MVRVIIESDKPISVNVQKQEDGLSRLMRDIKEGNDNDSDRKNAATIES